MDVLHGRRVADPYRWLEDADAAETAAWVEAQHARTDQWLAGVPARAGIRSQLASRWDYPRSGAPWTRGDRWFCFRNAGLQEQPVLWTMPAPQAEGSVLLDPNLLSEDGTVGLAGIGLTQDGALLAYGCSDAGSDWVTWRVRDVASGQDLDEEVPWSKFSGAAWAPDGSGFFYGAYDPPAPGEEHRAVTEHQQLRFHRLGTSAQTDVVIYARADRPRWGFSPSVTQDGRWLVVRVWHGTDPRNRVYLGDLRAVDDPTDVTVEPWLDRFDASYDVVGNVESTFYVRTDRDASRGRIVAIDAADPEESRWREVVPEGPELLEGARIVGGRLVVTVLADASSRLRLRRLDGTDAGSVELPGLGSVVQTTGWQDDTAFHFQFTSFTQSGTLHRHDLERAATETLRPAAVSLDDYVTEQVFVPSGGVRVPMFLVRRGDLSPTGDVPTLLYAYGGFEHALTPVFKAWWAVWLERGGLLAVAGLRGGGEYGRAWHDDGRLARKQHTFDDAIACAEWLTATEPGWTRSDRLAVNGASNGGLTVGACLTQRPDLFGACVPEVGVLDMLRFHRFTIGWAWTSDYGSADDPDQFETLLAYSPLHNLVAGTRYPATLVLTADHDDRVVPGHSFKFTAALQHAQGGDAPVLARIETRAGHGATTPTSKQIDARADVLAFLEDVLLDG